jgi:hypothetical protein
MTTCLPTENVKRMPCKYFGISLHPKGSTLFFGRLTPVEFPFRLLQEPLLITYFKGFSLVPQLLSLEKPGKPVSGTSITYFLKKKRGYIMI